MGLCHDAPLRLQSGCNSGCRAPTLANLVSKGRFWGSKSPNTMIISSLDLALINIQDGCQYGCQIGSPSGQSGHKFGFRAPSLEILVSKGKILASMNPNMMIISVLDLSLINIQDSCQYGCQNGGLLGLKAV